MNQPATTSSRRRPRRARSWLAIALLGAALGACASAPPASRLEQRLTAAGLSPAQVIVPYAINDEMRAWVRESVSPAVAPKARVDSLLSRLLADDRLDLTYASNHTGTAVEVWETHTANCVGFTHLFVGLAREVGLRVTFLRVDDIQTYSRDGDLVVVAGHMAVGYQDGMDMRVLDFSPYPVKKYRLIQPIDDHTAVAMYYSNRGAEELRAGRTSEAITFLQTATRLDPQLADGWVNLGVAYRRMRNLDLAETMYRQALEVDSEAPSAYQNLAVLMRLRGKSDAAEDLLRLASRLQNRNPYTYLVLGDWSLAEGRHDDALKFYRSALRVAGRENADPAAALGMFELERGNHPRAIEWLQKARRIDESNDRVMRLERAINLQTAGEPQQRSAL